MRDVVFPFLDLFEQLQRAGMALSLEQYELLRQALVQGFGLENWKGHDSNNRDWDDLRQVCRVLWVKPSQNYDEQLFERVFAQYVREKRQQIQAQFQAQNQDQKASEIETTTSTKAPQPQVQPERQWPQVPTRKWSVSQPEVQSEQEKTAPVAVKMGLEGLPKVDVDTTDFSLVPRQLPLSQRSLLDSWQFLRQPLRRGGRSEVDWDETIRRITQVGYFSEVVMRPVSSKRVELIVLVDDSNVMIPFRPTLQPLLDAIATRQITPAKVYRFTTYPEDYVYEWQQPNGAVSWNWLLTQIHSQRTVVILWGEAGASQINPVKEHRTGLMQGLSQLSQCVRSLIWLNPVPSPRWQGTLAQEVAYWLDGRMIPMTVPQMLALAKWPVLDEKLCLRSPLNPKGSTTTKVGAVVKTSGNH